MNKIINKQVLATFALVTIMAGVLIGTNCIYAAQDGKETTTKIGRASCRERV